MPEKKPFDYTAPIRMAWELMKKHFWFLAGLVVIQFIFNGITNKVNKHHDAPSVILSILIAVISVFVSIGIVKIILNLVDKKALSYEELYKNTRYFWRYIGASLLIGLIVVVGLVLLIIPGIYLAIRYQFVTYLIIDKNMSIGEAFTKSAEMTKDIKWDLFVFDMLLLGVIILGALLFGVGLIFAIPVVWIAMVLMYRSLLKES